MNDNNQLKKIFDEVIKWTDLQAKSYYLSSLLGLLESDESFNKLNDDLVSAIIKNHKLFIAKELDTFQCEFCDEVFNVSKSPFVLFCPYCSSEDLIKL
ncbi:MAG: hypothetical protein GX660_28720 [Clostridiaceae bacterium]|nr:hypothetical protein [Clostridiaceae bacterium]